MADPERGPLARNSPPPATAESKPGLDWSAILPAVIFVVIVLFASVAYWRHAGAVRVEQQALAAGLPDGYPIRLVPLPDGFILGETERDTATSTDNLPMDKWVVNGEAPQPHEEVFQYYKDHLLGAGLSQTQLISIPGSYYVEYGDPDGTISFEIDDERGESGGTRLKIIVHRLQ